MRPCNALTQILVLVVASASASAAPLAMTPDPLGDWVISGSGSITTRTAQVTLVSGDTSPTPTLELRTTLVGGGGFGNTTINFNFDFDQDVTSATITAASGTITSGPVVTGTADRLLGFVCAPAPCSVDIEFTFATTPTGVDVRDQINQFTDSAAAPFQTLTASFGAPVPVPSLGSWGIGVTIAGLLGLGVRSAGFRRRDPVRPPPRAPVIGCSAARDGAR
jgi:hypothetical protein